MKDLKTQFGTSETMNLVKDTWTFDMKPDFTAISGEFAILPKDKFDTIVDILKQTANLQSEHIKSGVNTAFINIRDIDDLLVSIL